MNIPTTLSNLIILQTSIQTLIHHIINTYWILELIKIRLYTLKHVLKKYHQFLFEPLRKEMYDLGINRTYKKPNRTPRLITSQDYIKNNCSRKLGLDYETFQSLYNLAIKSQYEAFLEQEKETRMHPTTQLSSKPRLLENHQIFFIYLEKLKHNETFYSLGEKYNISSTTLKKYISEVSVVYGGYNNISIMNGKNEFVKYYEPSLKETITIIGAIDCTNHSKRRSKPGSGQDYRRDKGNNLIVQATISVHGNRLLHIAIMRGHNNDAGIFNRTMRDICRDHRFYLLGDRGYSSEYVIGTFDKGFARSFGAAIQSSIRAVVENLFSDGGIKAWRYSTYKCRESVPKQALHLKNIYETVNFRLNQQKSLRERYQRYLKQRDMLDDC